MTTITHRELRNSSSDILRRVAAGETFEVTDNGEVTALLVPASGTPLKRLTRAGAVRRPRRSGGFADIRRSTAESTEAILADVRGDR